MTFGQPVTESAQIYNELVAIPYTERDEIGRLEWRLRLLNRRFPNDLEIAVALIEAFRRLGRAAEAHPLVSQVLANANQLEPQVAKTLITQLVNFGRFDDAFALTENLAKDSDTYEEISLTLTIAAIATGDLDRFQRYNPRESNGDGWQVRFRNALVDIGIDHLFTGHQKTVLDVIRGRFAAVSTSHFFEDEVPELCVSFFVDAERKERREIEATIDKALAGYYRSNDQEPRVYIPHIISSIYDIRAHWSDFERAA